jgi:hypothetical protein
LAIQPGSARRSPSAPCDERLPISIPDPILLRITTNRA